MKRAVHIIASCTHRKRLPVPADLRLRRVDAKTTSARVADWLNRLRKHDSPKVPATDLYLGGHWAIVKTLPDLATAAGFRSHLWVASAGYGLVPADAPIRSYSATFASGHPDSVSDEAASRSDDRAWWTRIGRAQGPVLGRPRTVTELMLDDPLASVIVVASGSYVAAMEDDILSAIAASRRPERIVIISGPSRSSSGALYPHLIQTDMRLQSTVGGACTSLHARVARKILREARTWGVDAGSLQPRYERILARSRAPEIEAREKLSDRRVLAFIRKNLGSSSSGHSPLLRLLRQEGYACEQARFRALYFKVRRTKDAR